MSHVVACIDGTAVSEPVSDYAAWASRRLGAPLALLHVLEKPEGSARSDLTGSIRLGSRESLLMELASLDEQRGRLALEQGRLMLKTASQRAVTHGVADPRSRQRRGSLVRPLPKWKSGSACW